MKHYQRLEGMVAATFTPMDARGDINLSVIDKYADLMAESGMAGVFVCGTTGESHSLTTGERKAILAQWIKSARKRFKVIAHVGSNCQLEAMELARHAQEVEADAFAAMAPCFFKPSSVKDLVDFFTPIAQSAPDLPFYYYHIPAFNGAFLSMVAFLEAVDGRIPNFAGIKYTFESMYEYNQCRLYKGGKFDMLHGQDETILPCLAMGGAQGGIGGTTNYNGVNLVGIIEAWKAGYLEKARELQNFSQEVINVICHFRGNIVGGKRIMKLIGLDLGKNRTPFQNMTDDEEVRMKAELEAIHFFDRCNKF